MTLPLFVFALIGYVVVGALIEQYDNANRTTYLTWYTVLILLTYVTAQRTAFYAEVGRLTAMAQSASGAPTPTTPKPTQPAPPRFTVRGR